MTRAPSPALVFGAAVTGIAIFSSMDAVRKGLVLQLGAFDTLFWRTLAGVVLTGAIYLPSRKGWPTRPAMRVHVIRGAVSAVMGKDRIPPRSIAASLVAFAGGGVSLLGQATAAPDPDRFRGTVAVLISAVCYAYNIVLMRQQALVAGPSEVAFFQ